MSPSDSTACPLDFVEHKLVAFDLFSVGGGGGGGGGGSCARESDVDDGTAQLTTMTVSSLSTDQSNEHILNSSFES
jgi:hypothetical protein